MRERGYDIDSPRGGGRSRLAEDAGVHRAAVTRLLQRQSVPDLETMRALARVLGVGLRDMLIESGRVTAEDLPLPSGARRAAARSRSGADEAGRVSPEEAAGLLGIPESHRRQFVEMTEMILVVSGAHSGARPGARSGGGVLPGGGEGEEGGGGGKSGSVLGRIG
ncbi:helix-turn-helix domain-containing protein [Streptomyces pathocidini]|uniref:Helix-turn-helix domain-containing protein n=1 Tax=Streptomyces pathocidini TaxID=1650571 RepID=A0ABW7UZS0_9ACTN